MLREDHWQDIRILMKHLGRQLLDSYYADIQNNQNGDNKISQIQDIAALIGPSSGIRPAKTSKRPNM